MWFQLPGPLFTSLLSSIRHLPLVGSTFTLLSSVPLSRSVHRSFGSHLVHRRCRGAGRRDGPNEMNGETERR